MVLKNLPGYGLTNIDYEWLQKNKNDKQKLMSAVEALKLIDPHRKIQDLEKLSKNKLTTAIGKYLESFSDNPWKTLDVMQSHGYEVKIEPEFFENHHVKPTKKKTGKKFANSQIDLALAKSDLAMTDESALALAENDDDDEDEGTDNKTVLKTVEEFQLEQFEKEIRLLDQKEIEAINCPSCRVMRKEYFSFDMKRVLDEPQLLFTPQLFSAQDRNLLMESVNDFIRALQSNGRKETLDARNAVVTSTNNMSDPRIQKFGNVLNLLTDRALSFYDTDPSKVVEIMKTNIEKKSENFNVIKDEFSQISDQIIVDPIDLEKVARAAGLEFVAERFKSLSSEDALDILRKSEKNLKTDYVIHFARNQSREDFQNNPEYLSYACRFLLLPDPNAKENKKVFHGGCMVREIPGIVGDYFKALMLSVE